MLGTSVLLTAVTGLYSISAVVVVKLSIAIAIGYCIVRFRLSALAARAGSLIHSATVSQEAGTATWSRGWRLPLFAAWPRQPPVFSALVMSSFIAQAITWTYCASVRFES
jgi:hypothetical protein